MSVDVSLLFGRMHPLIVHFPIGLLLGALALESWYRLKGSPRPQTGLVYLGTITALLAAIMGQVLSTKEAYAADLVADHQLTGWITAGLALVTAMAYRFSERLPRYLPFAGLLISCLSVGLTGHFGATITHGDDYLSAAFQNISGPTDEALAAHLAEFKNSDSLSTDQLDQLNLKVREIFAHQCIQCHSTEKRKGDLALDHKEGVFAGGENGPVLVAGKSAASELIRRLKLPRSDEDAMPPKGKLLSKDAIALMELWIDKGAHWADKTLKVFREAPLALHKPEIPEVSSGHTHPVDRFVQGYFAENGLKWPEPIDDRRFIRRAYLDVTGLLPEPVAVEQFVTDDHPDKRSKLIRDLLSDKPAYATHWLTFWNDLLRNDYTGTGFITNGRKRITDWLYQSLAENKSYDCMVAELVNPVAASEGFIQGIQWRGEVNSSQRTEMQAAQNVSQSLLGLNLKCASCHNSFVNNLTLDQAYGFANVFATAPLEVHRCDKASGRFANTDFLYQELGTIAADSLKDKLAQLESVMVRPENGRLYRTIVNRFWDKLFGRGMVAPVDEMDNAPWSQDLLDWLAADFRENGSDLSRLLEIIMTSEAYRMPAFEYASSDELSSEKFVFRGPTPRRMSAEQFADAVSQVVDPLYQGVDFAPGYQDYGARWIWYPDKNLEVFWQHLPGKRYFRKVFELEKKKTVQGAQLLVTGDDAFDLFLNGDLLASGKDWRAVQDLTIPPDLLKAQNVFAVSAENTGSAPNAAGMLLVLKIQYADSSVQMVVSDKSWLSTDSLPAPGWQAIDYRNKDWVGVSAKNATVFWGKLLQFQFEKPRDAPPFARASLVKLDPFMQTLGRPTRENVSTKRDEEATLLQALTLSNSAFFTETLQRGAQHWLSESQQSTGIMVNQLYQKAFSRPPTKKEQKLLLKKIGPAPSLEQTEDLLWSLLLLSEFQFI